LFSNFEQYLVGNLDGDGEVDGEVDDLPND